MSVLSIRRYVCAFCNWKREHEFIWWFCNGWKHRGLDFQSSVLWFSNTCNSLVTDFLMQYRYANYIQNFRWPLELKILRLSMPTPTTSRLEMMLIIPHFSAFSKQTWKKIRTQTFGALADPSAELVFLKCYVNSSSLADPLFLLASALWLVLTG